MTQRAWKQVRETSGDALIEAALVTPLLVLVTLAIVDFASLSYTYLSLENGVSQATRYAVTGSQMGEGSRANSIAAAMREATPTLTIQEDAFAFSHLAPGRGWVDGPGGPGDVEKVRVDYTWTPLTPLLRPFFRNGQVRLRVESAMKNEPRFN
jgi:Flp pilus assembly protein TadG